MLHGLQQEDRSDVTRTVKFARWTHPIIKERRAQERESQLALHLYRTRNSTACISAGLQYIPSAVLPKVLSCGGFH